MKKIVVCGGHLTPALAVIDELQMREWEIVYFGRKFALEGDKTESIEWQVVNKRSIAFVNITAGRLQRRITKYTLLSVLKIPIGFIQALYYLVKVKPQVVLSFGGYLGVPVVFCSWILGIPVIIHEQTLIPGLANKFSSFFASKICLTWQNTGKYFPAHKTIYTGNPIRTSILNKSNENPFGSINHPLIYITGGNLGSQSINKAVENNLSYLLNSYTLIHQCGNANQNRDWEGLNKIKAKLSESMKNKYLLFSYINEDMIGWVMQNADLIISRAGANTVYEIIALEKVAILIPLPWSGNNEQVLNAKILVDEDAAVLLNQKNLVGDQFITTISQTLTNNVKIKRNIKKLHKNLIRDAASKIVHVIESVM